MRRIIRDKNLDKINIKYRQNVFHKFKKMVSSEAKVPAIFYGIYFQGFY